MKLADLETAKQLQERREWASKRLVLLREPFSPTSFMRIDGVGLHTGGDLSMVDVGHCIRIAPGTFLELRALLSEVLEAEIARLDAELQALGVEVPDGQA